MTPLEPDVLPPGVRARFVRDVNGLTMHILEAGIAPEGRPLLLLLHGFPELAYSWRKVMPALAEAGYHVVAPDQRGYGRTMGWSADYDGDLMAFRMMTLVRDMLGLVFALGHRSVAAVIGHDFGSPVASYCALTRPDVFPAAAMMSAPFGGMPEIPFDTDRNRRAQPEPSIHEALAALPRPRKHYQHYYCTRPANADLWHAPQGVHDFLRAYYHHKSADWAGNRPHRLGGWRAEELAKMPTYYIMDLHETMPETVAKEMPSPAEIAANRWLPDAELAVYVQEYQRTGFQGGLQWYRVRSDPRCIAEMEVFGGRSIDVPSVFISGTSDWGVYQIPGALERMQGTSCTRLLGCHLIEGAGHWVQQEQPEQVTALLLDFLREAGRAP
jgi:pimeloyl-ACP methyl ester carboxylesterase